MPGTGNFRANSLTSSLIADSVKEGRQEFATNEAIRKKSSEAEAKDAQEIQNKKEDSDKVETPVQ